ncbi:MAG: hypothetical protein N2Z21_04665 [Candidatus Sumerlaeaceae bacterium]|nr:hypothetical protein [Candidatus Sumerlaeaceae bacterium]
MKKGVDSTYTLSHFLLGGAQGNWLRVCLLGLVGLQCYILAGCESPEMHIAKAKKLVAAPSTSIATPEPELNATTGALDLRSADFEGERYLPVLERLERRQQTIIRVLSKQRPGIRLN